MNRSPEDCALRYAAGLMACGKLTRRTGMLGLADSRPTDDPGFYRHYRGFRDPKAAEAPTHIPPRSDR
ncbi:hypothetical protein N9834_01420 [Akkermansiaceae bacterium]|nr:hypothetical protein [Akkermansiaceae bacterium]MDB0068510.1 hypothetical protein [Akkermansiaceae bacterium]MDB4262050.1 hypothetical protein [Akkermansiaceae bacterium]MDB4295652.1 hypothetical protein [Akkermansiaceae bacterium]MDB4429968.1 hypothetical protein [Akkermansiaceae bacterium]